MTAPQIMPDIRWGNVSMDNAIPCQWYYKGSPCTLLQWGMRKGETSPCVQTVRTTDGEDHLVWRDKQGTYPGLEYELLQHNAGQA